jgi:flagellar motor switch protein FliN/FliY
VKAAKEPLQDALLSDLPDRFDDEIQEAPAAAVAPPRRDLGQLMRRIPVSLTLEVGAARISLKELTAIEPNSVIELDTLAGEPLTIKVNGTPIGRAEVVVCGENYGLKVLQLDDLSLGSLTS